MPGLGAAGGKFQISTGWHSAWAHKSYFDSRVNRNFTNTWRPYERISIMDVSARWNVNPRFSVSATLPIAFNRFSLLLPPVGEPRGNRYGWNVNGLGDLTLYTQTWVLKPEEHPFGNFAIGVGMKIPTGDWNVRKMMPDETGRIFARRTVYPAAVLPGDGGVGAILGVSAYKVLRAPSLLRGTTVFGSAQYLFNPRITNGAPSMVSSLGVPLASNFANSLTNSVTDSYSWQAGLSMKVPGTWRSENLKGLRLRFLVGMEGTPAYDFIGSSRGFRQPGWTVSLGPGLTYQRKRDYWMVEVPFIIGQYINPARSALPGAPVAGPGGALVPAPFNPGRQMGLVAPMALSVRYVRSL